MPGENELHLGFGAKKTCPFPLNRGVPFIEATDTTIIEHCSKTKFWGQWTGMLLRAGCRLIVQLKKSLSPAQIERKTKMCGNFRDIDE